MAPRNQFPASAIKWRQFFLLLGWLQVLFIIGLTLTPVPVEVPVEQGDKFGHILAYAVVMSWFANLYEGSVRRTQFAIGFVVLGIVLEFVQGWSGFRSFEIADMAADAGGVAAGWALAPPRIPNYLRGIGNIFRRN